MSITLSDLEIALQEDANNNKALIAKHKKEIQDLENNAEIALLKKKLNFFEKLYEIRKNVTSACGPDMSLFGCWSYVVGATRTAQLPVFYRYQSLLKEAFDNRYFNETYAYSVPEQQRFYFNEIGTFSFAITRWVPPAPISWWPGANITHEYFIDKSDEAFLRLELKTKLDVNQQKIDQLQLKIEILEKQQFLVDMQIKTITAFENQLFSGNNPGLSHLHNQSLPSSSNDNSIAGPIGMGIAGGATVSLGIIAMVKLYDCYAKRKQPVAPLAPVIPIRQEVVQPEPEPEQEPADNGEGGDVLLAMLNAPDPIADDDNEPGGGPEGMPHGERRPSKCKIM